jgi:hypothetical protein
MSLPPVFRIYEGETVYSVISRYHAISGFFNNNTLVSRIFDVDKKRIHPYLPNGLKKFATYFEESLQLTIKNRTLLPLFEATLESDRSSILKQAMIGDYGSPFNLSSTPQYGFKLFAGHKYCPECAIHDLKIFGTSYWHIVHQLPGMAACATHHSLLEGIKNDDSNLNKRLSLPPMINSSKKANSADVLFSNFSIKKLNEYKVKGFNCESIEVIAQRLKTLGFITQSGQLRYERLITELKLFWQGLDNSGPLGIPASVQSFDFIGPMFSVKTRTTHHPLKYHLILCWLESLGSTS